MIAFVLVCAGMVILTLVLILKPSNDDGGVTAETVTRADALARVYRRQLAELMSDRRRGALTKEEFAWERAVLEQRVIDDIPEPSVTSDGGSPRDAAFALPIALVIGIPLAVLLLYLVLGSP